MIAFIKGDSGKVAVSKIEESDTRRDGPQIKAETWFALAIASFIITMTLGCFFALWVFRSGSPSLMVQRAQAFTPFGAALLAIVTFCTVAWRGVLNTTQLQHTADQLAQSRRQNDAKDEEMLAKLLMDGTKLLGDPSEAHVLAGVAALQAVVTSPRGSFAPHAMDILADLVGATYNVPEKYNVYSAARNALERGAELDRMAARNITIDLTNADDKYADVINGVRLITYVGATVDEFQLSRFRNTKKVRLQKCLVEEVEVRHNAFRFEECKFDNCAILSMTVRFVSQNEFDSCDFSGARIAGPLQLSRGGSSPDPLTKLKKNGNYYFSDAPPVHRREIDWSKYLIARPGLDFDDADESEE